MKNLILLFTITIIGASVFGQGESVTNPEVKEVVVVTYNQYLN